MPRHLPRKYIQSRVTSILCFVRTQRTLLLSVVELKAASWLALGDSSPAERDDQPTTSNSQPDESADTLQNVIEYSDDDDDAEYVDRNFDIV